MAVSVGCYSNQPEPSKPETLESLVAQAKKMEGGFTGIDLANQETRAQYTKLLAEIFVRYYPLGISKEQLLSSVVLPIQKPLSKSYLSR